jgi:hypothetical protein
MGTSLQSQSHHLARAIAVTEPRARVYDTQLAGIQ